MRWLVVFVLVLQFILPSQAHANRSVHRAWEQLMENQLVQAYYCAGILGDLYRAKVYPKNKTKRYLRTLFKLLGRQKLFLVQRAKRGSRTQRKYFRHVLSTADMLLLTVHSLQKVLRKAPGAQLRAHFRYRNAAAKNIQKMLGSSLRKRRRYYRGGRRTSFRFLGQHLGTDLALSFLAVGVLADGYFQRILPKSTVIGYLKPSLSLQQTSIQSLYKIQKRIPSGDQTYIQKIQMGQRSIRKAGQYLQMFITTRNRAYLRLYTQQRTRAWSVLQLFASP